MDPESAHELAVGTMGNPLGRAFIAAATGFASADYPALRTELCGMPLVHPIGLAAGFDKNAHLFHILDRLGFAYAEVGTVTAKAQAGNPKPRLFRLPKDDALINRMGFNNDGADAVAARLKNKQAAIPIGGNIGKSKVTPIEESIDDYLYTFRLLKPLVDYMVVNVSSPNTPNLRSLQDKEPLKALLGALAAENRDPRLPLFLKIAPDLNEAQLEDIIEVVTESGLEGVIATNTTIGRDGLQTSAARVEEIGAGGLSGAPVRARATEVIRFLRRNLPPQVVLIGVGGIFTGADAYEKIRAGAHCVQVYTGFVYGGPASIFKMAGELNRLLKRDGFQSVKEAVGADLT